MNTIDDCRMISLPRIDRPEGTITPVEAELTVPFTLARVYYIYDVVHGAARGGHAHRKLHQLIVAVMSRFVVTVDDGARSRSFELDRADEGLYVPPMIWRSLERFSSGAVAVVLASLPYDESDYIRDRDDFLRERGANDTGSA
jgi:dTDP-4-dehydrorhamnose 3,5-epimerase-like enzyme